MKQFLIRNLDPQKYEILKYEEPVGGSRPRIILKHRETRQRFFLKTYAHNTREIWAELLASKIGELIGLDIQKVSIKNDGAKWGAMFKKSIKNILSNATLFEIAKMIFKMPNHDDIVYTENRKRLLFESFTKRMNRLKSILL